MRCGVLANQVVYQLELRLSPRKHEQTEERFRQMAETIDDAVWILDVPSNRIVYASPREYESVFGHSREELYRDPHSFKRDMHPDDLPRIMQAVAKDRDPIEADFRIVPPGAPLRWVSGRTFPVYNSEGKVVRLPWASLRCYPAGAGSRTATSL